MSAPGTQRYQDIDLRIDPILIGHAIAYAKQYEGEWDLMVAAREIVRVSGSLPLPVARTVLNCARSDPRYAALLPPPRSGTFVGVFPSPDGDESIEEDLEAPDEPRVAPRPRERPRRGLRVVRPERDPRNLKSTWPKRYGHTRDPDPAKNVWHVVDPVRSHVRYWPEAEPDNRYRINLYWVCWSSPKVSNTILLADPPIGELSMCRTCRHRLENEELLEHEHFGPLQQWWITEIDRLQVQP